MERKYDWNNIQELNELSWIPDRYDIEEKMLFRSPLLLINHLMWNQLVDYIFYNQINSGGDSVITIHAYYTVAIHQLRKLFEFEIPANEPFDQEFEIENISQLREKSVHQSRLENCLTPEGSEPLREYLEQMHRIPNIEQYCDKEMEKITVKGDGSVEPYDRVFVVWAIDLILGLYRENTEGSISLVGCSDYLVDFSTEIYPKSNNYWVERVRNEMISNRTKVGPLRSQHYNATHLPKVDLSQDKQEY